MFHSRIRLRAQSLHNAKRHAGVDFAEGRDDHVGEFALHNGPHIPAKVGRSDDARRARITHLGNGLVCIPGECTEQLGVQGPTASRRDVSKRPSERLLEPRIERQRRDATIRSSEARCDVGRQPLSDELSQLFRVFRLSSKLAERLDNRSSVSD